MVAALVANIDAVLLGVWQIRRLVIGRFAAILGFGPPLGFSFRALADSELGVVSRGSSP